MLEKDVESVTKTAIEGFWSTVKRNFPHAGSMSVDPTLAAALADAARRAAFDWALKNDRNLWTERGSVVRVTFVGDSEHGEKEILAYVWDSNFQTFRSWATIRPWSWELRHYHDRPERDPGAVKLEFDPETGVWSWICADSRSLPIKVELEREAAYKYACDSRCAYQIRELVCEGDHLLMEFPLTGHSAEDRQTRAAVDRLVGELNMLSLALTR